MPNTETPRHKERAVQVLKAAYPDLTEKEVRRLLEQAQSVKRREIARLGVYTSNGRGLEIEPYRIAQS